MLTKNKLINTSNQAEHVTQRVMVYSKFSRKKKNKSYVSFPVYEVLTFKESINLKGSVHFEVIAIKRSIILNRKFLHKKSDTFNDTKFA